MDGGIWMLMFMVRKWNWYWDCSQLQLDDGRIGDMYNGVEGLLLLS